MSKADAEKKPDACEAKPPRRIEGAVVDCGEFRCLAYQGKDGKWRDVRGKELSGVVRVISEV